MSIASRITSIEGHIGDIYDSVELTGVDTTDIDKNLVNVPNTLKEGYIDILNNGTDTLYNNFPKVSGEGTSLTLNNTYQAPMRNNLKGNTSQIGTPTPTSPIPVNVVSGDNTIAIDKKNKLNAYNISGTMNGIDYTFSNGELTLNGTCTATFGVVGMGEFIQKANTQYMWTYIYESGTCTDYGGGMYLALTPTSQTQVTGAGFRNGISRHVATLTNTTGRKLYLYMAINKNMVFTNYKMKTQIVEGTTDDYTFEQYDENTYNIDLPMGINLYDFMNNTYNNEGNLTITKLSNGFTFTNNSSNLARIIFSNATVDSSKNYVISFEINNPSGKLARLGWSGSSKTVETSATSGKITGVLTGITTSAFSIYIDGNSTITITNLMYYEGTNTSKSYEPYGTTPIELCKIGNYQDYFAKSDGRNLFDGVLEIGGYGGTGEKNDALDNYRNANIIQVKPSTTYTFSINGVSQKYVLLSYDANKVFIGQTLLEGGTFTTGNNVYFINFRCYQSDFTNDFATLKVQLEKGSSATPWQPYGVGKWYLHKEIGKVTYNGTENWTTFAINYEYQIILQDAKEGDFENQFFPSLCNKYVNHNVGGASLNNYEFSNFTSGVYRWIRIRHNDITTLANYKTWLASNTPTFYYLLATPTNTEITDTTLINQLEELYIAKSKENQTNISQINNDLGFIISASALKKG